jgi:hypothetical protein
MSFSGKRFLVAAVFGVSLALVGPGVRNVGADVVDFDALASGRGGSFTGNNDSPLVSGIATFSGGELLNAESGGGSAPDQTGVYATIGPAFVSGGYSNPLTITFSSPVSGFSLMVTNVLPDTFTVADNLGGSSSAAIATGGQNVFSLSDVGITSVTIMSTTAGNTWDFAIDNVTFTPASVPEPSTMMLGGIGAVAGLGYGAVRRRSRRKA